MDTATPEQRTVAIQNALIFLCYSVDYNMLITQSKYPAEPITSKFNFSYACNSSVVLRTYRLLVIG